MVLGIRYLILGFCHADEQSTCFIYNFIQQILHTSGWQRQDSSLCTMLIHYVPYSTHFLYKIQLYIWPFSLYSRHAYCTTHITRDHPHHVRDLYRSWRLSCCSYLCEFWSDTSLCRAFWYEWFVYSWIYPRGGCSIRRGSCRLWKWYILSGDNPYRLRQCHVSPPDTRTRRRWCTSRYPWELHRWCTIQTHRDASRPEQYIPRRGWEYSWYASPRDCNRWHRMMTLMSYSSYISWVTFLSPVTRSRYDDRWESPHRGRTPQTYESYRWLWSLWWICRWD